MAKQIKPAPSSPNLASAYDLIIADLFNKLAKIKEGTIKLGTLGTLHKKRRIMKSALNGRTYAYYQHRNNQPENQNNQQSANSNLQNQPNQQSSGLMQLVGAVLPALLEHFTGQKMTQNSNSPETQLMLSQILMLQQQIITNQQDLNQ
ncbi:7797_t:CDS:2, partial [Paraglomus brasilianum]